MPSKFTSAIRALRLALLPLLVVAAVADPASAKTGTAPAGHLPPVKAACSWDRPGVDPFMGDVVAAVDRYTDIPVDVRQRLKERMAKREYDDLVSIQRDRIVGDRGQQYNAAIRDMHFGAGSICHTVSRDAWSPTMQERGLVYCERNHCVLVPTVCRNVSRIARRGVSPEHAEGPDEVFAAIPPAGVAPDAAGATPVGAGPVGAGTVVPLAAEGATSFAQAAAGGAGGGSATGGGAGALGSSALASQTTSGTSGETPISTSGDGTPVPTVTAAVPEPGTWGLMVAGLLVVGAARRRGAVRQRRAAASGSDR